MPGDNYHDQQTIMASASHNIGAASGKIARDHQSGCYLIVDVTSVGAAGTVRPQITLRSQIISIHTAILWQAAAAINAVGTYVYLFMPEGIETLGAVDGFTERIALPLPYLVDVQCTVAGNACIYSVEAAGIAL